MRQYVLLLIASVLVVSCASDIDPAKDELDRLKDYMKNLHFLQAEDELDNVANDGKEVSAEEIAVRSACDTEMTVPLTLPSDPTSFSDDVRDFVVFWNECLGDWSSRSAYADWVYETDLTDENEKAVEETGLQFSQWRIALSQKANKIMKNANYDSLDTTLKRHVRLMAQSTVPTDPHKQKQLINVQGELQKIYSTAKVNTLELEPDLTKVMAESHDPSILLAAWWGWRDVTGPTMKDKYEQMIALLNTGAQDNGFSDYAQAWIESQFDSTDDMEAMAEQLWSEIEPLYKQLHAYVRDKLGSVYHTPDLKHQFESGAIPAHLLGNMWAQQWDNIYELVKPYPQVEEPDYDSVMEDDNYTVDKLFQMAEEFYTSIGLYPMTGAFKQNSMKTKPADRDVVCHAAAFDFYTVKPIRDFRIKMCTEVNMEYFETIHHEMGHIEYFMAYQDQPTVFRDGANSGFHEAIGDTISLSVMTKEHLKTVGLDHDTTDDIGQGAKHREINYLLKRALSKVAFLPFGYMIDKWRWDVFRGTISKDQYNRHWWDLRLKYQGLVAPVTRSEADFDPGAKFHIPSNSPYICYFISFIIQFQFYEAMCNASGHDGDLHTCDFYQSQEAGAKLKEMLEMGKSKPWPEAMHVLTGTNKIDTTAILKYFKPLLHWLKEHNDQSTVGWKNAEVNWES